MTQGWDGTQLGRVTPHHPFAASEDELRSHLAAIVESSDDAIIGNALDGTIASWNRGAERIFGYTADEVIGHNISMLAWPGHEENMQKILQRVRNGESVDHYEAFRKSKDGRCVTVSLTVSPIRNAAGTIVGASKVARDISDRGDANRIQALLAAIVESSDDAIVSKTLDGIVTSWNRGAERIFGYSAEDMIGSPISRLYSPGRKNDFPLIINKIRSGERVEHYETFRRRKDGKEILLSLTVSPIRDHTGKIIGASKVARDITGQRAAAEALRKAEKLAITGRMAASIAHEINNPLEAVTNLLYLLERQPMSPEAQEYLAIAQRELARVAQITTRTLRFYRPRSPVNASVAEVLDEALSLFSGRLDNSDIAVIRDYRGAPKLNTDHGELRQVFANLVGNAIDAMPKGGRLHVRVSHGRNWKTGAPGVRVAVADTGTGMTPETRRRLFEPFYTTKGNTGTGLGLWVSSEIVNNQAGSIAVRTTQSAVRSGSIFVVFLPANAGAD